MCGISGIVGREWTRGQVEAMVAAQSHRGPDDEGLYLDPGGAAALGHNRLSIIDPSPSGRGPMRSPDGRYWISFNGEIYNYVELRHELEERHFASGTDTEVLLAAYERWGPACLDRLVGMFAFLVWDEREQVLFAARDRFGVKPLLYAHRPDGGLALASEIVALHACGVPARPDPVAWATYFELGVQEHSERTFWEGIASLPPGGSLTWRNGHTTVDRWYDLAERTGQAFDERPHEDVEEEALALLTESVRLRFRSDVPVGVNLSGGLDSSILLELVHRIQPSGGNVKAFTFVCGDERYDELPWVRAMLAQTEHPLVICALAPDDVPALAASVQRSQQEPFGGIPTLAYANLFERAKDEGAGVLLDGQGLDEQWAGYDYYLGWERGTVGMVPGATQRIVRPEGLHPDFRALAESFRAPEPFPDSLRNLQYRDALHTKIPKNLRFNDRISMRASRELREPFLDHRLFELAMRQPVESKIADGSGKRLLRDMVRHSLPRAVREAPKRSVQTPQREWLRGPLVGWADEQIERALSGPGASWLDADAVRASWRAYREGESDNSFYVWQWVSLGLTDTGRTIHADGAAPHVAEVERPVAIEA